MTAYQKIKEPFISVIINTYNRASLLPRAIKSVLAQTYHNYEILIVDAGSKDNTWQVAAEFKRKSKKIRYIRNKLNKGMCWAINKGVSLSKGDYVALLDDDDEWFPDKLKQQVVASQTFMLRGQSFVCFTKAIVKETSGARPRNYGVPSFFPRVQLAVDEYLFCAHLDWLRLRKHKVLLCQSSILASRKLFRDVPFDENDNCHADWDWYLRALKGSRVFFSFVRSPLVFFSRESGISRITWKTKLEDSFAWLKRHKKFLSRKARAAFALTVCSSRLTGLDLRNILNLLGFAFKEGSVSLLDLGIFVRNIFRALPRTKQKGGEVIV